MSDLSWMLQHGLDSLGNSNYMLNDTNKQQKKSEQKAFSKSQGAAAQE